jgi:hypothetical protein
VLCLKISGGLHFTYQCRPRFLRQRGFKPAAAVLSEQCLRVWGYTAKWTFLKHLCWNETEENQRKKFPLSFLLTFPFPLFLFYSPFFSFLFFFLSSVTYTYTVSNADRLYISVKEI